jgi:hypothetical protein
VFEDWIWHVVLPLVAYLDLLLAHMALRHGHDAALHWIGGAALLLLFIGIHNAWDAVTYLVVSHRRDTSRDRPPFLRNRSRRSASSGPPSPSQASAATRPWRRCWTRCRRARQSARIERIARADCLPAPCASQAPTRFNWLAKQNCPATC